jgi:hypothetical protein
MRSAFLLVCLSALLLLPPSGSALIVGGGPSIIELGQVSAGEEHFFNIYISSQEEHEVVVDVSYMPTGSTLFTLDRPPPYEFDLDEYSEEDIQRWLLFIRKTVSVPPDSQRFVWRGKSYLANVEVPVILRVPAHAEPGYHAGFIQVSPRPPPAVPGQVVQIATASKLLLIFKVKGQAVRSGRPYGFVANTLADGRVRVSLIFENNGTVSMSARLTRLSLRNVATNQTFVASGTIRKFKPGELGTLDAHLQLEPGRYEVVGHVDWFSGEAEVTGHIVVLPPSPRIPTPAVVARPHAPLPALALTVVGVLLALAYLWSRRAKGRFSRIA